MVRKIVLKSILIRFVSLLIILPFCFAACNKKSDLRKKAEKNHILFGTAVNPRKFNDPKYYSTLTENFNVVTPENVMKWETIHPEREKYNFKRGDEIVEFAQKHGMKVRGHTLLWHNQNSLWLNSEVWTRDELLKVMEDHIKTVVGHYRGKVYAWDVVNEALDGDSLRTTIWSHYIGPEYIEYAFKWAHEADPDALLYYNDYSNGEINDKSNRMYTMLKELKGKGVPIHGVGLQLHLTTQYSFDFESLYMNVHRLTQLGLAVDFTEVDIRLKEPIDQKSAYRTQANWYANLMEVVLAVPNCDTMIVWGLSDAHSWIPSFYSGYDEALIFDKKMEPKPAYFALLDTLSKGPQKLPYSTNYKDKFQNRKALAPFRAIPVEKPPVIDGRDDDPQWKESITYPFSFNQLNSYDLRPPASDDLWGNWSVVYKGNTIYGLIRRHDDQTTITNSFDYENDNIEVFFRLNDVFAQLRSIVGKEWRPHNYEGERTIAWSDDGTVCEYSIVMPDADLTGLVAGWNISLSDNDGNDVRDHQLYPVNGQNVGWQGKELGTIQFMGNSPRVPEKKRTVVPFKALGAGDSEPAIDGTFSENEWENAVFYPISFDQKGENNQDIMASPDDISATWGVLLKDTTLYGFVLRSDDMTVTSNTSSMDNDNVAVYLEFDENTTGTYRTVVGKQWESDTQGQCDARWSDDGSVLEFTITLPEETAKKTVIGFNIALTDADGEEVSHKIYPVTGSNKPLQDMAELQLLN